MSESDKSARHGRGKTVARRLARLAAAQALYEIEVASASPHEVVPSFVSRGFSGIVDDAESRPVDALFFEKLVLGTVGDTPTIDPMLTNALEPEFKLGRLEVLLRAILRLGAYELLSFGDVPAKVVITEYVELGRDFFSGREPALVNAVLDRLARLLREGEIADRTD
ncbi:MULTISPECIES: transcription antitermination factor NusB [Thalassobaculum]|uniref:Transcription antitermination protein NusB n=1 Tax=Thalassobaculum litoreum DSM 18839 TaxID=1123362 RepID=A0A8G2BEQ5_9PROT|nr:MULTISPECIES: transcription antitermination factor NusB [Thalassobaculum]SDF10560.1 NusB antitermination factor [Thalassobaculum litoreum DSM 18839]